MEMEIELCLAQTASDVKTPQKVKPTETTRSETKLTLKKISMLMNDVLLHLRTKAPLLKGNRDSLTDNKLLCSCECVSV
ncbi:hypothetical protein M5D96_010462 [Drosophila gunungcola]|uniref:Uncharacterized protein n=1 Tax=Drosophila gunungcola TaxID=103775 RepID=A0A9P9YGZ3_9MUSC|nr:hypothetical protein M5D96_010462 [Drosophila gunungcola]